MAIAERSTRGLTNGSESDFRIALSVSDRGSASAPSSAACRARALPSPPLRGLPPPPPAPPAAARGDAPPTRVRARARGASSEKTFDWLSYAVFETESEHSVHMKHVIRRRSFGLWSRTHL